MTSRDIGLFGALALCIGVFCPLLSSPLFGSIDLFQNGSGDGVIVVLLSFISVVMILLDKNRHLYWTGGASLALIIIDFLKMKREFDGMHDRVSGQLAGNPFRGLADLALGSIKFEWGWFLLFGGALALIISARLARQ